jgi:hypothetical protein
MAFTGRVCLALLGFVSLIFGQAEDVSYRVYTEQPRLLLRPQRLRLLKRERDRQSMRWEQFNTLIAGKAQMPEPGFASALFYAVTGDPAYGKLAIDWAESATDIRQVALVYDWCQDALTAAQGKALAAKLAKAASALAGKADLASLRDRAFAAIAIADIDPAASTKVLRDIVQNAWRQREVPILRGGAGLPPIEEVAALYELLHTIRDNLNIDLRDNAGAWFKELPALHLLQHYPAPYPAPENEYRIPAFDANSAPDLRRAALSRATELSMVAYDSNAADSQFLQGWLMQDRFLMRSPFGITYEFLWANPYQPGLSYYHFPLAHHDPNSGALFVRSSWDDDATWFGRVGQEWQTFQDGKITVLNTKKPREPLAIGETALYMARDPYRFAVKDAARAYVIGLDPHARYEVEVDDREMDEQTADGAGTLDVVFSGDTTAGVRVRACAAAK